MPLFNTAVVVLVLVAGLGSLALTLWIYVGDRFARWWAGPWLDAKPWVTEAVADSLEDLRSLPDARVAIIKCYRRFEHALAGAHFRRAPWETPGEFMREALRRLALPPGAVAELTGLFEVQVTVEGQSFPLERPFLVVATQNPVELEGTYPLPEAQLDRFLMRLTIGYPGRDAEREIITRRRQRRDDLPSIERVASRDDLLAMQAALEDVFVAQPIEEYIVDLVQATRSDHRVALGASPRASLALLKLARAEAALRGRDFVTPDDVKAMAAPALAHRLILRPELWVAKLSPVQVIDDLLVQVPTPKTEAA